MQGFPSHKLHMGLALYGRAWETGSSCDINTAGAGACHAGHYSAEPGLFSYYEVRIVRFLFGILSLYNPHEVSLSLLTMLIFHIVYTLILKGKQWNMTSWVIKIDNADF